MFDTDIPIYGIMIILALIINILVVYIISKKYNFNKYELIGAIAYENIGIICGAKILTYLSNSDLLPMDFWSIGLSSYGGVIGALICLIIFSFQFKKSLKEMLFIFMPSISLMYAIGKIGCFLVGCCYGIEYNGFGSITYKHSLIAPNNVNLFPIQIIETFIFILIFIYIMKKIKNNKLKWNTLGSYFILCGFAKFILDFLRSSHLNIVISLNQIISIVFIILGVILIIKDRKETLNYEV